MKLKKKKIKKLSTNNSQDLLKATPHIVGGAEQGFTEQKLTETLPKTWTCRTRISCPTGIQCMDWTEFLCPI